MPDNKIKTMESLNKNWFAITLTAVVLEFLGFFFWVDYVEAHNQRDLKAIDKANADDKC